MALGMPPAVLYLRRSRFAPTDETPYFTSLGPPEGGYYVSHTRAITTPKRDENRARGGHEPAKPADNIHQVVPWG